MLRLIEKSSFLLFIFFITPLIQITHAEETITSKYFNIDLYDNIDKIQLLEKIDANYFLRLKSVLSSQENIEGSDIETMIADTLDAIYAEVSDMLDMHLYSFSIDIEIVPDKASFVELLKNYPEEIAEMPSFYIYDNNKIYISYSDLNAGMLSHEIAHAIISHYFETPPPKKVQEVLAGYVGYSIRKLTEDAVSM